MLVGGCVAAAVLGSVGAASAAADDCVASACSDRTTSGNLARPGITGSLGELQTVRGIPCTGSHLGACIALRSSGAG
ncbi:hypothetical protein EAH80_17455 [Mycobacterium hodleri]|uniref:Secreted protein n=2 Tax=Mycolicibacterium hodleri TaxID=49897 RepID=A0A502E640_9MYCO|nr:hypothetical protein EAH80_17455 [Mycolicibacterium hodleri]